MSRSLVSCSRAPCGVAAEQPAGDRAADAAAEHDQPAAVLLEQLEVHPRFGPERVGAGGRHPGQVRPALGGLRQQGQVLVGLGLHAGPGVAVAGVGAVVEFPWHPDAVVVAAGADRPVHLLADDRFHPGGPGGGVEPPRPGERAVVGDRDRPRAVGGGLPADPVGGGQPVAGGVLGVHVQVHELAAHRDTGGSPGTHEVSSPRRRCGGHRVRGRSPVGQAGAGPGDRPCGSGCTAPR